MPAVAQKQEEAFDLINASFDRANTIGEAAVALPDLDPDAGLTTRFLKEAILPSEGTKVYSGDSRAEALITRAPELADLEIRPLRELLDLHPEIPLYLLDASRIDQANVGGPVGVVPDVVIDTHVGQNPLAKTAALLSQEHVATGSLVTELARYRFGDDASFWKSGKIPIEAAGMRFGIYTDSGEDNYATQRDKQALHFLASHADEATWKSLLKTPFFLKVQALFEKSLRLIRVQEGFAYARLEDNDLENCRDYLGAVADRLLHHLNGVSVMVSGPISKDGEQLCCFALRLNKNHKAFDFINPNSIMARCSENGGGYGSQINGQVWGGSIPTEAGEIITMQRVVREAYFAHAKEVERGMDGLSFDSAPPS